MPTKCSATTKDGHQCLNNAKPGQTVCGIHKNHPPSASSAAAPKVKRCRQRMTNGDRCSNACAEGHPYCGRHVAARARQARQEAIRRMWAEIWDTIWTRHDVELARDIFVTRVQELQMPMQEHLHQVQRFDDELDFYAHIHPHRHAARPPPKSDLEAFTRDTQNVHTAVTVKQTNETLDMLLATPVVFEGISPLTLIQWRWCDWKERGPGDFKAVLKDMTRWYETPTCREENDWLYKRTLDGLWMRIKDSPMKDELLKRVWEEANDSLKMCCEGHISRLCNVLVGFDDAVKPQVSAGELLQQKMSAIAAKDIGVEHKVVEAWAVFEELGIPREQRADWIEAF